MVKISSIDLENLESIGLGGFGKVYKVNDKTAYKIYRKDMYDSYGTVTINPCLKYPNLRLYLLKKKEKNLKYTEFFQDYLFVDNRFAGVVIPFYEGNSLIKYRDASFPLKIKIAKDMVRNSEELTNQNIYTLDYKLSHMIISGEELKFIDLDDVLTKVFIFPHSGYLRETVYGLGDTLYSFFYEFESKPYSPTISKLVQRKETTPLYRYEDIIKYIESKKEKTSFVTINYESDLSSLKDYLSNHSSNVIYECPTYNYRDDYYFEIIQKMRENGISIFDFVCIKDDKDLLPYRYNIDDYLELKGKQFVKKCPTLD